MLIHRERFKVAFLLVCAEHGLTIEESHGLVKEAIANISQVDFEKQSAGFLGNLAGAGLSGTKALLTSALLAPIAIGGVTGYALGRGTGGLSEEDVFEEKQKELTEAYRTAAERALNKKRLASRRAARPVRTRSLV